MLVQRNEGHLFETSSNILEMRFDPRLITKIPYSSNRSVSTNLILHISIVVEICAPALVVFSFVQLLRVITYNRTILLSLYSEFFDRSCYTLITFVLAMIEFTHIDMICINTRMITTARYLS